MKKIVLTSSLVVASSLYGVTFSMCYNPSPNDVSKATSAMMTQTFNAVDADDGMSSIKTHKAGEDFEVKIIRSFKPNTNYENITYKVIDTKTHKVIVGSKNVTGDVVTFNVPDAYKDLSIEIDYDEVKYSASEEAVACPANPETLPSSLNDNESGEYAKQTGTKNVWVSMVSKVVPIYTCYKKTVTENKSSKSDISTDNFAVRPANFDIHFKKSTIKEGQYDYVKIKALTADSSVTKDYNNSSMNLKVDFRNKDDEEVKAQYSFTIIDGVSTKDSAAYFFDPDENVTMTVVDEHYADVDVDDTTDSCRYIKGESNKVNVLEPSKYWVGTGTDKIGSADCPIETTVQTKVKQHVKKDLHFQNVNW